MMKNTPAQAAPYLKTIYGLNDNQVQQFLQRQTASLVITGVPADANYANQAKLFNAQPSHTCSGPRPRCRRRGTPRSPKRSPSSSAMSH